MHLGEIDDGDGILFEDAALVDLLEIFDEFIDGVDLRVLVAEVGRCQRPHRLDADLVEERRVELVLRLALLARRDPHDGVLGELCADVAEADRAVLRALHEHLLVLGRLEIKCHHNYMHLLSPVNL